MLSRDISRKNKSFLLRAGIGFAVFLCVIGLIFLLSDSETDSSVYAEPITVASGGEFKERPENPDGAEIPHRGVEIYQQIEGKSNSEQFTQRALPESQLEPFQEPAFNKPVEEPTALIKEEPLETEQAAPEEKAEKKPVLKAAEKTNKNAIDQALEEISKEYTVNESVKTGERNKIVQLIAVQSEGQARIFIQDLKQKYGKELNSISLGITSANIPNRGTYYRVQSNFLSQEEAVELCSFMLSKKVDCIILNK